MRRPSPVHSPADAAISIGGEWQMQSGALFGRYRLDRSLSVDENGEVWAAFDTVTARHVTVRALPRDASEDDEYCDRFVREAGLAAHIRNPHVVPIHDFGQIGNRLYLATPLTGGTNLRTILQASGPMEATRAAGLSSSWRRRWRPCTPRGWSSRE